MDKLFNRMGELTCEVKWLKSEYEMRCTKVGDIIRMEQGDLSVEMALNLPSTTVLGFGACLAFVDLLDWTIMQVRSLSEPLS